MTCTISSVPPPGDMLHCVNHAISSTAGAIKMLMTPNFAVQCLRPSAVSSLQCSVFGHVCEIFDDIEDMAWFTSSLLSTIINEHAPMKRKLVKQESVPYMSASSMYRPNMARNKFRLYGKQYWHENRRQRNLMVSLQYPLL